MPAKGGSTIQVCIRLCPCEPGLPSLWQAKEGRSIQLADGHAEPSVFDYVFDEGAGNQEVFDGMAQHIVRDCMQGFNGTIFAYGQTSSGKTYTMMGDGQSPGIMVLAAKEIFQQIARTMERDFLLRASYIEIYNEKINDLLDKKNQDLKLYEDRNGLLTLNSMECVITSEEDLMRLIRPETKGEAHTLERSGHSHVILRIIIESWSSDRSGAILQSILNLVDLAGSERLSGDSPTGSRVSGGVHIGKSLMFLSNVMKHLSDNKADNNYISFRDCKLTRLLQSSLCGNAYTSVISTIRPSVMEESQSTLNFAMRAKKIRIHPQVNKMERGTTMMEKLDAEIKDCQGQLAAEKKKEDNQQQVQTLENKLKAEKAKILSGKPRLQMRRCVSYLDIKTTDFQAPKAILAGIPENSRLPRPSKPSQLQKPKYYLDSAVATKRDAAAVEVPTKDKQLIAKYDAAQAEILALTASNQAANVKIKSYEEQVEALKQNIARLEMDNHMAVEAKQQAASQFKEQEDHLFTTISQKDLTIEELKRSLNELSRDVLSNSKQDHLRSLCPEVEPSCKRICNQCQELGRLLSLADGKEQEWLAIESRLRSDIDATRLQLESVQAAFNQATCEVTQKTDDCHRLVEDNDALGEKNRSQLLVIENMQAEYEAIQQKYNKLQEEYESLEQTSTASEEQCQKLQADNTTLQLQIETLKQRVEEAQRKLMAAPSEEVTSKLESEVQELESLRTYLKEMHEKYLIVGDQLKESVKENEVLREELRAMQASTQSSELVEAFTSTIEGLRERVIEQQNEIEDLKLVENALVQERNEKLAETLKLEQANSDEINALKLEYLAKMERSESENRAKFREYNQELEHLRSKMVTQNQQEKKETRDLEEQVKAFAAKFNDLEEEKRAQLEAVSNEHKELVASSKEQIQELRQKYDQLAIYTDNLREEKSILQLKIDEADAQHSSTLGKLHKLEIQMSDVSKQKATEKSDLEEKLETMAAKMSDLKLELESTTLKAASRNDLVSEHDALKVSLMEATRVSSTLQEKVDSLQSKLLASEKQVSSRDVEMETIRSDLKHALEAKESAIVERLGLSEQLQAVEEKMASQAGDFEKELADLKGSMNELQLKLKSLQERKVELKSNNQELKAQLKSAHYLKNQLEEEQKLCASLRAKFAELEETKAQMEKQLRDKAEVNQKFLELSQEAELGRHSIGKLTKECDKLRFDLETKTNSFQREKKSLASTISSLLKDKQLLEERIRFLNLNENRNAELISKLKAIEAESESSREAAVNLKLAADAANMKCRKYMDQKVELAKELRNTFKTERESMNATISSLLEDKRNLEEKQCTLFEKIGKLEDELSALQAIKVNGCNLSSESNAPLVIPIPVRPVTPNKLDGKASSVGAGAVKKSSIMECAVRKERRKTAYDEHRRQSYWNDVRDSGTMTDPEG